MGLWKNDRYTAMQHRVICSPDWERFSIPIIYNPCYDTRIECLPSGMSAQNFAHNEAEVTGDYLVVNFSRVWDMRKKVE